jgi:hypothetical protein
MSHWVEQAGMAPSPKSLGKERRRSSGVIVGDGPDDLDEQLAHIPVLPRWIGGGIALAIALAVWALIIFGVYSLVS